MKKFLILFGICCTALVSLTLWLAWRPEEPLSLDYFLEQKFPGLVESLPHKVPVDVTALFSDARPAELTNVDLFLPHYQNYRYTEIKALFEYSRNCKLQTPHVSAELRKALHWIQFTCDQNPLPKNFFKSPPYLFPSGKSFVQLAEETHFDLKDYLKAEEIPLYKSFAEVSAQTELGTELNSQQLRGLLGGEEILLGENFIFLRKKTDLDTQRARVYFKIPRSDWAHLFSIERYAYESPLPSRCLIKNTSGCWMINRNASRLDRGRFRWIVFSLDALLILTGLIFVWVDQKRRIRLKEKQKFILQMLTHELRTPVTTLSLLLENIRRGFDHLSSEQQIDFLKMGSEIARLKNSMQMSYAYLQTDAVQKNKMRIEFQKIDLVAFLPDILAQQNLSGVQFLSPPQPVFLETEKFWFELCVGNLLRNAFDHGQAPVQLLLSESAEGVRITVQDAGTFNANPIQAFQRGSKSKGLGLGLSIVAQIVLELRGVLEFQKNPTRFTLFFRRPR